MLPSKRAAVTTKSKYWLTRNHYYYMSSWNVCLQTIVSIFKNSNKLLGLVQNRHDLIEMYLVPWYSWRIAHFYTDSFSQCCFAIFIRPTEWSVVYMMTKVANQHTHHLVDNRIFSSQTHLMFWYFSVWPVQESYVKHS